MNGGRAGVRSISIARPGRLAYVRDYAPNSSGQRFNPHVTTGLAPPDSLDATVAEPFEPFTRSPAGLSVYQLGLYGAARRRLRSWGWESENEVRTSVLRRLQKRTA